MSEGIFRRRNLPHIDAADKPYFVTGCLQGSLSASALKHIRDYQQHLDALPRSAECSPQQRKRRNNKLVFAAVDKILDTQSTVQHLSDDRLAKIVRDAFYYFAGDRYDLLAYVVMPSHHHWLFEPRREWEEQLAHAAERKMGVKTPREIISHSIQSFTASECNKVLGRRGPFWQQETFDHYVRDDAELTRVIAYIEQNPVKANLVDRAELYPWSSAHDRQLSNVPIGHPLSLRLPA